MTSGNEQRVVAAPPTQEPQDMARATLSPSDRLGRLCVRWERSVAEFLQTLPDELLSEVVCSADSSTIGWVVKELGLESQWKKKASQKLTRRAAFNALVQPFRERLGSYQGDCCLGTAMLCAWWGRWAETLLTLPALKAFLASKPLHERIIYCDEWMLSQGVQLEAVHRSPLESTVLSRLPASMFADLLMCVSQGASKGTFKVMASAWTARVLDAPIASERPATPAKKELASAHAEPPQEAPPSLIPPPAPLPAPSPALPARLEERPMAPVPVQPSLPPELEAVWALLSEIQVATRESTEMLARGRFKESMELGARLLSLQERISGKIAALEERLNAQCVDLPGPLPEAAFSQPSEAEAYLAALQACVQEANIRGTLLLQQRTALAGEFERLGLSPPESLSGITTFNELQEQRAVLARVLDEHQALQHLLSPNGGAARESLPLLKRLEFYERAASEAQNFQSGCGQWGPQALLEALQRDGAALAHEPGRGRQLIASTLIALLDQELQVPPGTWRLFRSLCETGSVVARLRELDVLTYLAVVPESLLDVEGLYEVVVEERESLSSELRHVFVRLEVSRLPPSERISQLAAMALDGHMEEFLLRELLRTLVAFDRHAEAVLLAILAMQASPRFQIGPAYESLLVFLVEQADLDGASREFIGQNFLHDAQWLGERPEDMVVLLYLILRTERWGLFDNLEFSHAEVLREAQRAHPALVDRWLMPQLKARAPVDYLARHRALVSAREALRDWDHNLRKESCYRSWTYATDYQRLFNGHLIRLFEDLNALRALQDFEPDVLIEELEREHQLPKVKHPALPLMVKYLLEQLERLRLMELTLPYLEGTPIREGLSREEPDLRAALEQEQEQLRHQVGPSLRHVYARALEKL